MNRKRQRDEDVPLSILDSIEAARKDVEFGTQYSKKAQLHYDALIAAKNAFINVKRNKVILATPQPQQQQEDKGSSSSSSSTPFQKAHIIVEDDVSSEPAKKKHIRGYHPHWNKKGRAIVVITNPTAKKKR